ncbi:class I SAM-dependent methyltransferase, partial [bacterium]|nr:class I SAM-dependent methyltransferase [bacterium]
MNIDHNKKYYAQSDLWGKPLDGIHMERAAKIISYIPKDVKTVLEIGCGDGIIINRLHEKGLDCTGIDISKEALKYVNCKKEVMSSDNLKFQDQAFDLVICSEVLEHLPEQVYENTLKEIESVAKKHILITTPYHEYLRAAFKKCRKCGTTYHTYRHLRTFDELVYKKLFPTFYLEETIYIGHVKRQNAFEKFFRYRLGDFYIDSDT